MLLESVPDEIKLAIDLIQILEENKIPISTVLAAIAIVQRDYEHKQSLLQA